MHLTLALLYAQAMFVAGMIESQSRLEAENLFSARRTGRMQLPANVD